MLQLNKLSIVSNKQELEKLPDGKLLINTINVHSYNDALLPDGISIVKAYHWLKAQLQPIERIAGWDFFEFEMNCLNQKGGKCFFMGSK